MSLSSWQLTIKTDVVLTNKSPIVIQCMQAQEYKKQEGVSGFDQRYIPIELDLQALLITSAKKGAHSEYHRHQGGSLRYIISGKYEITYRENEEEKTETLQADDWIYIPHMTPYKTLVLEDIKLTHLYCATNCKD
jgi:uncharacterized RmlC-like cupin family protein